MPITECCGIKSTAKKLVFNKYFVYEMQQLEKTLTFPFSNSCRHAQKCINGSAFNKLYFQQNKYFLSNLQFNTISCDWPFFLINFPLFRSEDLFGSLHCLDDTKDVLIILSASFFVQASKVKMILILFLKP